MQSPAPGSTMPAASKENMMTDPDKPEHDTQPAPARKTNLLEVTQGVLAGLFGVQSQKNRERDFKRGDARDYIAVYVLLVIAMVVGMIVAVNMVISAAGH